MLQEFLLNIYLSEQEIHKYREARNVVTETAHACQASRLPAQRGDETGRFREPHQGHAEHAHLLPRPAQHHPLQPAAEDEDDEEEGEGWQEEEEAEGEEAEEGEKEEEGEEISVWFVDRFLINFIYYTF